MAIESRYQSVLPIHSTRLCLSRRQFMSGVAAASAGLATFSMPRAASAEGTVAFLGWETQGGDKVFGDWAAKNHVTIQSSWINEDDDIIQKLLAGGLGQYDVCNPDIQHAKGFAERGLLQPIPLDRVPSFAEVHPHFQQAVKGYAGAPDGTTYLMPNGWGMWALLYRADNVGAPPTSWGDLLDPKYKGKIAVNDDYWAQITLWSRLKGYSSYPNLTRAQLDDIKSSLIELKRNARTLTPTFADATDLLVRGDVWLATPGWPAAAAKGKQRGPDIRYTVPKEGTGSWIDNFALVAKAPHLDNGIAFINYGASVEGQTRHANAMDGVVNQEAIKQLPPELRALYPYDDLDGFFARAPFAQVPPLSKSADGIMSIQDWLAAWEDVKQA
jgi:spermidine/putrescine transport system substrate-binding protein